MIGEICLHESVEHYRKHRHRNEKLNQFCHGLIWKCRGNSYASIAGHYSQIAKHMGPTWGPSGSSRPQMGPMLASRPPPPPPPPQHTHTPSYNMRLSPHHIFVHVAVAALACGLSNLGNFKWSPRCDGVSYTYDVLHQKCKRPRHPTCKISNLYMENKYLLAQKSDNFQEGCTYKTFTVFIFHPQMLLVHSGILWLECCASLKSHRSMWFKWCKTFKPQ